MSAEVIFFFLITDLAFCLTPGPATMVTVSHTLSGGFRNSWGPIAGINVGNFIWYAMSATGLAALATTMPQLFTALRYAGIAYLVWMGISMLRATNAKPNRTKAVTSAAGSFTRGFVSGLAVHMSNPKALLFYVSFIPQFIDPASPIGPQILILAIITIFTETFGLVLYAGIAAKTAQMAIKNSKTAIMHRIAGSILLLAAFAMLFINN